MKQKKLDILSNQLRTIIDGSGLSQYRIAKECGIDKSALSRFMSGERGLSTENLRHDRAISRIAAGFGKTSKERQVKDGEHCTRPRPAKADSFRGPRWFEESQSGLARFRNGRRKRSRSKWKPL